MRSGILLDLWMGKWEGEVVASCKFCSRTRLDGLRKTGETLGMESGKPTLCVRCEGGILEVVFKDTIPSSPRLTTKIVIGLVMKRGSPEGIQTGYLFNKRNQIQDRFDKFLDPLQKQIGRPYLHIFPR
jgi:hypothetical protein